ncbi:uncharacterized protein LOC132274888 [Cornus florida]|uniref:uncharacterized protein LOC132274888 n=1 Tax=Cornus florida TaxID=4283 RepID=UPI0028A1E8F9|nr:uncharacterized protein LOC132274888 [Cornus florida]
MASETPGTSGEFYADKHAHNVSEQTGEEFSAEFLRDRVMPRNVRVMNDMQPQQKRVDSNCIQDHQLVYEDLTGLLGIKRMDSESGTDNSDASTKKGYLPELEKKVYPELVSRHHKEYRVSGQQPRNSSGETNCDQAVPGPTGTPLYGPDSPNAYQLCGLGSGVSDCSFSGKMKFLCSFGGRILPRPSDGKLRYVGGETRIISIRKNLSYAELVKKTSAICNQRHTIKYQLPGEDLDALISVSSDEDFHHMIEEYHDLEKVNQRLRIFLVSSVDPESPCSFEAKTTGQQCDVDYQYVVAVNGMLDPSPRRSSSTQSLASQASLLGSNLDCSPTFQRDSPTSLHPRSFHVQLYEDRVCSDGHDQSNNPIVMDQPAYDNSYGVEATSCYYNHPREPVSVVNYHHQNKQLVEPKQTREVHFLNRTPSRDLLSSPLYCQGDIDIEGPLHSEKAIRPEKILYTPEDSTGLYSVSDVPVGAHPRMSHALSDSHLQDERLSNLEEGKIPWYPLNSEVENSPSLAMSNSSQERLVQRQQMMDEKNQEAKNDNQPAFKTPDNNKESIEWGKNTLKWKNKKDTSLGQDREHYEGNLNISSYANAVEHNINLPKIHCYPNSIPRVHISQQEAQVPGGISSLSPAIDLDISANSMREQPKGYQLNSDESEFLVQSQKTNMDLQHSMTGTMSDKTASRGSSEVQPIKSWEMSKQEPIAAAAVDLTTIARDGSGSKLNFLENDPPVTKSSIRNPTTDTSLDREFYLHDEDLSNHPNNVLKSGIIVEDVTDSVPPDIPSSSTAVPHIQDDSTDEILSPRETDTESVAPESDYEDYRVDKKEKDESISDAIIAEMEAGIYGLQIIKNADLEELQELGSGTYGTVYHGKWRGTDVAIKRIKKSCFAGRSSEQERLTKDFWREAQILSKLHHPNVVAFYGVVPDGPGGTLATVTEYMVNGSLRHVLVKKDRALDRRKRLKIAMDAAFGMEYLHLKNIVHFDLKCDNLLVNLRDTQRPICKVGDFGLSRIKRNTLVSGGVRGTLPWMAPELLNGSSSRVSEKVDVFSFGVAMWELLTGEEPYANMHCGAIIGGIVSNTLRPPIPERCDTEWRKLMEECWSPDPAARPSFTEITNRLRDMSTALQPKRPSQLKR